MQGRDEFPAPGRGGGWVRLTETRVFALDASARRRLRFTGACLPRQRLHPQDVLDAVRRRAEDTVGLQSRSSSSTRPGRRRAQFRPAAAVPDGAGRGGGPRRGQPGPRKLEAAADPARAAARRETVFEPPHRGVAVARIAGLRDFEDLPRSSGAVTATLGSGDPCPPLRLLWTHLADHPVGTGGAGSHTCRVRERRDEDRRRRGVLPGFREQVVQGNSREGGDPQAAEPVVLHVPPGDLVKGSKRSGSL